MPLLWSGSTGVSRGEGREDFFWHRDSETSDAKSRSESEQERGREALFLFIEQTSAAIQPSSTSSTARKRGEIKASGVFMVSLLEN